MAEAHSAVAFQFSITHEGWDVNFDREVLHLVWQSGIRSWKKRLARFKNSIKNGVYPASLQSLWAMVAIIAALHFTGVWPTLQWQVVSCTVLGIALWLTVIYFIRYTLKLLFIYKGWMYEERGKGRVISNRTKLWVLMVKALSGASSPLLYSFQGSLPRLPLPSVQETMKRVCNTKLTHF
ncbi:unnamed protein product, partial [Timema podura]|nr:unnamed protein product [Timema podura]